MLSELESDANRPEVHDFKSKLVQGHTSATGMPKVTPLTGLPTLQGLGLSDGQVMGSVLSSFTNQGLDLT